MQQLGREGHRERMRKAYLHGDMKNAPEHNLLELFLSLVIVRKDVKQLSYDLINTFGSLEGVLNATPYELMTVNGVGESTAVAISLVNQFARKIAVDKNKSITRLKSLDDCFEYCRNLFFNERNEKVYIITLTANNAIIDYYLVGEGSVNSSSVDMKSIITYVIKDNPSSVLITHNHPGGSAHPSGEDASFTVRLNETLKSMNVNLFDHIIVAEDDEISLKHSKEYLLRF